MSDDDLEERLAPALDGLKAIDGLTEQRERWLRRLAEDGWDARALYAVAETWANDKYGGPS